MKNLVAPSILSADFANLGEEVKSVCKAGADFIHVDVMDGHFVKNITIGPEVIKSIKPSSNRPLDVHLMISNPSKYIKNFVEAGSDIITVHIECPDHLDAIKQIKESGIKSGIAISPKTSIEKVLGLIDKVDLFLIMTVEPGFGAQAFMKEQLKKIQTLKKELRNSNALISVDGGINDQTFSLCKKAGADVLVSGSYIFKDKPESYARKIQTLKS